MDIPTKYIKRFPEELQGIRDAKQQNYLGIKKSYLACNNLWESWIVFLIWQFNQICRGMLFCCVVGWNVWGERFEVLKSDSDSWFWWKFDMLNQKECVKAYMSNSNVFLHISDSWNLDMINLIIHWHLSKYKKHLPEIFF